MPQNTNFSLSTPRYRKQRGGLIGVTPDVMETFGSAGAPVQNPTQTFNPQEFQSSALQNRANELALDLGYDPQEEIATAQTGINAQFDESQNKLARIFALDPGGTKSGTAQNRLETLETGRATTLATTKQDILNRAGTEQRANISTLDAILSSTQNRNIAGATSQSQLQTDSLNRAIASSGVTGTYTDPQTGQTYTPQAIKQYQDQLALQQSQVTGQYQGQQTLASAAQSADINLRQEAQRLQTEIQRGSLSVDQANQQLNDFVQREQVRLQGQQTQSQLANESLQRAIAAGSQTGQFIDPQTGQAYTTEQVRQFNEQLNLQKAGLTGELGGKATLQGRSQQVTELNAALERAVAQGNATGTFTDPMTGVSQETLQAEIARAQTRLQESAANLNEAAQVAQLTGKFVNPTTGETLDTLAKTDQAFQQEVQRASLTGDLNGVATLAARSLALQEAELTGQVGDQKTVAQKALDLQGQIQKGQLALQQQAQAFGQNITEAELTGTYDRMGNETGAFQASFNAKSGEANYNARYDFNSDGVINFSDWTEFAKISNNEPVQTLQGQVLQEQKALNDFNKKVTESGLTGTFSGNQTVQEAQRRFENSMKESQLFVDAPPMTLNINDYSKAFNSQQGQANYRKDLDIDSNGVINFTDFIEVVGSGRIEVLSGSVTDPFGSNLTFTYKPEGKTSVIAAQLGLDEKRLSEQTRQFNQTYEQARNEFLTNTTGIVYDEQGNPTNMTTLQQQQYDEAKRKFNKEMEVHVSEYAQTLGFNYEELTTRKDIAKDTAISQAILAGFGALGQLGSTALGAALGAGAAGGVAAAGGGAVAGAGAGGAAAGGGLATAIGAGATIAAPFLIGYGLNKLLGTSVEEDLKNFQSETTNRDWNSEGVNKEQFLKWVDDNVGKEFANQVNILGGKQALDLYLKAYKKNNTATPTAQQPVTTTQQPGEPSQPTQPTQQGQPVQQTQSTYTPTQDDFPRFQAAYNAQQGQPNYNADFDFNGNGAVDYQDYLEYVMRLTGRPLGA